MIQIEKEGQLNLARGGSTRRGLSTSFPQVAKTSADQPLKVKEDGRRELKKGLLFLEQPSEKTDLTPLCTMDGKFFEHLMAFLELLDTISQSNSQ